MQKSQTGNPEITRWRDSSPTPKMQMWGHSGTSGRSCFPGCLKVTLFSSSFPGPLSGALICSWCELHKVR